MILGLMRLANIPSSHGSYINATLNNSEEVKLFYRVTFTFVNVILLKFIFFQVLMTVLRLRRQLEFTQFLITVFSHFLSTVIS